MTTSNVKGSSETTREAFLFNFDRYYSNDVPGVKRPDRHFLEWFVGFTEGGGSFILIKASTRKNPQNTACARPCFVINQKEPQVLYKIKKEFGFGSVIMIYDKRQERRYHRYRVVKLDHIRKLIQLFHGNLILEKVGLRFETWVSSYNTLCEQMKKKAPLLLDAQLLVPAPRQQLHLHSAWLAGFTDADGGFYASLTPSVHHRFHLRLRTKFYIKQKGERDSLEKLDLILRRRTLECLDQVGDSKELKGLMVGGHTLTELQSFLQSLKPFEVEKARKSGEKSRVGRVSKTGDIYQLEIHQLTTLMILIDYFDTFLLVTRKKTLMYVRWRRVILRRDILIKKAAVSEKALNRYRRMVGAVGRIHALSDKSV